MTPGSLDGMHSGKEEVGLSLGTGDLWCALGLVTWFYFSFRT